MNFSHDRILAAVAEKIESGERLSFADGLTPPMFAMRIASFAASIALPASRMPTPTTSTTVSVLLPRR